MHAKRRIQNRLRSHLATGLVLVMAASVVVSAAAAGAAGMQVQPGVQAAVAGYRVYNTGKAHLQERSGPSQKYPVVRKLTVGTPVDISCQDYGQAINGSSIWDRLSDGGWVSDFYISTPGHGVFSPGIPQCGASSSSGSREQRAIEWARAQIGQTTQPDGRPWNGWCDRFVANAYGLPNSSYITAYEHWLTLANRKLVHPHDTNVPAGALAFYNNAIGGHVMLSEGNGWFVSTGPAVYETKLSSGFGTYLGWAYPDPSWPGR